MTKLSSLIIGNDDCRCETVAFRLSKCASYDQVILKIPDIAIGLKLKVENRKQLEKSEFSWWVKLTTLLTVYRSEHGNSARLEAFLQVLEDLDLKDASDNLRDYFNGSQDVKDKINKDLSGNNQTHARTDLPNTGLMSLQKTNEMDFNAPLLPSSINDVTIVNKEEDKSSNKNSFNEIGQKLTKSPIRLFILGIFILLGVVTVVGISLSFKDEINVSSTTESDISYSKVPQSKANETWSSTLSLPVPTSSADDVVFTSTNTIIRNVSASSFTELNLKMAEIIDEKINLYITVASSPEWQKISNISNSFCVSFLHVHFLQNFNVLSSILFHLSKVEELVIHLGEHFKNTFSDIQLNYTLYDIKSVVFSKEPSHNLYANQKNNINITHEFCKAFLNLETMKSDVSIPYTSFVNLGSCEELEYVETSVVFSDDESFWDVSSFFDQPTLKSMILELEFHKCPPEEHIRQLGFDRIQKNISILTLTSNCNLYTNYNRHTEVLYTSYYENRTAI